MKIFKCFIFISFFLFCFSCVTDNSIYTANVSNNTQLYFLRPVQINVKNESLKTVDFDITLYVKDNELVGTPILNCTYYTAVLIECGFISNPEEEKLLNSKEYKQKMIDAIYKGILLYFGNVSI